MFVLFVCVQINVLLIFADQRHAGDHRRILIAARGQELQGCHYTQGHREQVSCQLPHSTHTACTFALLEHSSSRTTNAINTGNQQLCSFYSVNADHCILHNAHEILVQFTLLRFSITL
jgi:hypothetical protein